MMKLLLLCLALASLSLALRTETFTVTVPRGQWVSAGTPESDTVLEFQIALRPDNINTLEATLLKISDPTNSEYGNLLSVEEVAEMIRPNADILEGFYGWLVSANFEVVNVNRYSDLVTVKGTVRDIENVFQTKMSFYKHTSHGIAVCRPVNQFTIPADAPKIIHYLPGFDSFPAPKLDRPASPKPLTKVTPSSLYELYNVTPTQPHSRSSQAPVEFYGNFFSKSDLQTFFKSFKPSLEGQVVNDIYGQREGTSPISIEANLDVQYIMAMGQNVNTTVYNVGRELSFSIVDAFVKYGELVNDQDKPPLVHSISFGMYGGSYTNSTVQRWNTEAMKMGVRGVSVLLASGDNGVGCGNGCSSLEFDFPSTPYITMVGATNVNGNSETGATLSSGGFSGDYNRPSYQAKQVDDYLNSGVKLPKQKFFRNGRAYPDIAAAGVDFEIVQNGRTEGVSGTSCSAPTVAGLVSMLNNYRLSQGKSPLGFLNPFLYQNADAFNDITSGSNPYSCCEGFKCTTGWDPVTGLGTPNFGKLLDAVKALP